MQQPSEFGFFTGCDVDGDDCLYFTVPRPYRYLVGGELTELATHYQTVMQLALELTAPTQGDRMAAVSARVGVREELKKAAENYRKFVEGLR